MSDNDRESPDTAPGYRVYTRDFDKVVDASQLLKGLSATDEAGLEEAWKLFGSPLHGWLMRAAIAALEAAGRVRTVVRREALRDTIVTLLIDQS